VVYLFDDNMQKKSPIIAPMTMHFAPTPCDAGGGVIVMCHCMDCVHFFVAERGFAKEACGWMLLQI
jgi:hypothetical protein